MTGTALDDLSSSAIFILVDSCREVGGFLVVEDGLSWKDAC